MTLPELSDRLKTTGMPVTYRAWPEGEAPGLPFICYLFVGSNNLFADGGVFHQAAEIYVELYTRFKDLAAEKKVEASLQGVHWQKTETYIDTERCYKILYEIEV